MKTSIILSAVVLALAATVLGLGLTPVYLENPAHASLDIFWARIKFRVSRTPIITSFLHWVRAKKNLQDTIT